MEEKDRRLLRPGIRFIDFAARVRFAQYFAGTSERLTNILRRKIRAKDDARDLQPGAGDR
jgi:hypothetical protein